MGYVSDVEMFELSVGIHTFMDQSCLFGRISIQSKFDVAFVYEPVCTGEQH